MKNISHNSSGALKTFESCVAVQSTTHESFDSMAGLSFSPAAQDSEVMKKHTKSRRVDGAAATPTKRSHTPSDAGMAPNATTAKKKTNPKWLRDLNAATSFIAGGAK